MNDMTPPPTISRDQLIAKYIAMRDKVDALYKDADTQAEPYKQGMAVIEGVLTADLLALSPDDEGKRSISTESGTVFRQKWTSAKVEDREAFLQFVFNTTSEQFLTNHVSKEAVIEYMDEHNQAPPPGIKYEAGWKTLIRRK